MSRITLTSSTDADWFYPRLCILHESGTVTASSTASGFSAAAIVTPLTYTAWKASSLPATAEIDFGANKTIGYIAIHIKNIGTGATVEPEYWNGSAWVSFGSSVAIAKKGPYCWMKLTGISTSKVRLSVTGTASPQIAFAGAGAVVKFECGIPPGFEPASLNPDDKFTNNFSEGGQILSAQKTSAIAKQAITIDGIAPSWVQTNWPAIRAAMNSKGMFFAFNPKDAADELIYGMRGKQSPSTSYTSTQYMAVSFSIEGPEIEL